MNSPLLLLSLGIAAASGAALAGCGTPACHWSSLSAIALKTRLSMLRRTLPGKRRTRLMAAGLSALFCAAGLTAYAAQPSAPERLATQAAGVVGSGDQLSLRLVEDSKERTIKPGDDYADGWKLDALTPTSATLTKDGERRQVGLNPTGALASAQPAAPASQVKVQQTDEELLAEVIKTGIWDGVTPKVGLTADETRRWYTLMLKGMKSSAPNPPPPNPIPGPATLQVVSDAMLADRLGAEGDEYRAMMRKQGQASYDQAVAAFQRFGPVQVPVPTPGDQAAQAQLRANYPGARWAMTQSSTGERVMVMMMPAPSSNPSASAP